MHQKESIGDLKRILRQFKQALLYVGLFSIFINLLGLTQILYMLQVLDRVISSRSVETLIMLTLVITVLVITWGLLEFARSRLLNRLANRFDVALHERLFYAMFENGLERPGEGATQPLNDLNQLRNFLTGSTLTAFFDSPWLPIYLLILYIIHPWFAIFGVCVSIISILLAVAQHIYTKELIVESGTRRIESNKFVSANIKNAEIVSALGMRQQIKALWKEKHFAYLTAQTKADDVSSRISNISSSIKNYAQMLVLGLGGYLAITGSISAGMIIAARILMGKALGPLNMLIGSWNQVGSVRMAYRRLDGLLEYYPPKQKPMPLMAPQGNLLVDKIFYVPKNNTNAILKEISFILFKGESLAVIGQSAAGKSTLAKVLMGFWPATHGTVRLDGADIAMWDRDNLGKYIGYLPQDIELFDGTVSDNICRFGMQEPEKVIEAAVQAGIHHMILGLPNGYDTVIGSDYKAYPLSGGEKQRIGLARALYNKPVFIVLDEPNSNLDEQGEAALLKCLESLKEQGSTVVIVTHRPNILEVVDKVLLLNSGMLQLFGPRDKVMDIINNPSSFDQYSENNREEEGEGPVSKTEKKAKVVAIEDKMVKKNDRN